VVVPTATPGLPSSYTLRAGEFPYCIARRFNVDPGELLRQNGLGANTATSAGLTLQIPQSGNPFPGERSLKAHPTTYTVRAGDTVNSIACQFGDVDPDSIAIANSLGDNRRVEAGQTLQIP
jgi:LysM repeat protein